MGNNMNIPPADSDAWNTAEGKHDGKPSLIRYRPNLHSFLGDERYPRRLVVIWEFESNSSGMPSDEQSDDMREFEDAIVGALDADRCAVLAFVYTHSGIREWHFYLNDVNEAGSRFNESLSEFPKLPISLQVENDFNWDELRQVYALCQ